MVKKVYNLILFLQKLKLFLLPSSLPSSPTRPWTSSLQSPTKTLFTTGFHYLIPPTPSVPKELLSHQQVQLAVLIILVQGGRVILLVQGDSPRTLVQGLVQISDLVQGPLTSPFQFQIITCHQWPLYNLSLLKMSAPPQSGIPSLKNNFQHSLKSLRQLQQLQTLPSFKEAAKTWNKFKVEVLSHYPGALQVADISKLAKVWMHGSILPMQLPCMYGKMEGA
ncbi:hypothetical protein BT96DRAFT_1039995 [Gymnopus androsaceus JB14]|uniref:Uncharacterized protein n=1 Tax=Gymnopus androsaceus JB14 TaxID=1447944 RepID=A0A6A4HF07_9AGAR|nr:hypothetical protein BT96DRAFT_1039995 [Gymnopus androsaceus JB14]